MIHHHIRWSGGSLDWTRFETIAEAKEAAQELVKPGETYSIESFNETCSQCLRLVDRITRKESKTGKLSGP
jgi:hypothetical protein